MTKTGAWPTSGSKVFLAFTLFPWGSFLSSAISTGQYIIITLMCPTLHSASPRIRSQLFFAPVNMICTTMFKNHILFDVLTMHGRDRAQCFSRGGDVNWPCFILRRLPMMWDRAPLAHWQWATVIASSKCPQPATGLAAPQHKLPNCDLAISASSWQFFSYWFLQWGLISSFGAFLSSRQCSFIVDGARILWHGHRLFNGQEGVTHSHNPELRINSFKRPSLHSLINTS